VARRPLSGQGACSSPKVEAASLPSDTHTSHELSRIPLLPPPPTRPCSRSKYGWVRPWLRPRPVPVIGASDLDRPWRVVCGAAHTAVLCVGGRV
jgi:hypothetical protein